MPAESLKVISPEVTRFMLQDAARSGGNDAELTSTELDGQIASQNRMALSQLASSITANNGTATERDTLMADNHRRTAQHLLGIRRELFGDGQGAVATTHAVAKGAGFTLRWNNVPELGRKP